MYVPLAFSAFSVLVGALALTAPLSLSAQTAPTCTLVANPAVTVPGRGFTLSIISTGATSATINNGIGSIAPNGSRPSISIAVTTTYTATVTGAGGSGSCSTTVIVDTTSGFGVGADGRPLDGGAGGGGGGGGTDPSKILQGLGQMLGGLGQLQNALGGNNAQNAMCQPAGSPDCPGRCGYSMIDGSCRPNPADRWYCVCTNTTGQGVSTGMCQAGQCLGQSTQMGGQGPLAGGAQGLGGGLQALGSILQGLSSLMGGGGGGGSGSGAGAGGGGGYYPPGCTQYYYTATTTSDPCAIYQPNYVSDGLYRNDSSLISDSLFDDYDVPLTPRPISDYLNPGSGSGSVLDQIAGGDTQDDRDENDKNAGVLENLRKGFSTVAGLFGGDTLERACLTRPWAGQGALAGIAPDSFFDDLCRRAGYTSGFGNGGNLNGSFGSGGSTGFESGTTTNIAQPTAEIRAEPASVRLGTRTYIFWTSDYVTSCSVTGPSFTQNTLFGAGATVPITGPTSFVINCIAPDGTMVSDSVTVNLAL